MQSAWMHVVWAILLFWRSVEGLVTRAKPQKKEITCDLHRNKVSQGLNYCYNVASFTSNKQITLAIYCIKNWQGLQCVIMHNTAIKFTTESHLLKNWRTRHIDHSQSVTKRVSWHGLHERQMRGQWREIGQCLWVVHCSTDHVDSWVLTTSDRWSREQGCWHVVSQQELSRSQSAARPRRLLAVFLPLNQEEVQPVTGSQFCLHTEWRHRLMTHQAPHPCQQPLKHCTTASNVRINFKKCHIHKQKSATLIITMIRSYMAFLSFTFIQFYQQYSQFAIGHVSTN